MKANKLIGSTLMALGIISNLFGQTPKVPCNVKTTYKDGVKIQESGDGRLIFTDEKNSIYIIGEMIKATTDVDQTINIILVFGFNTNILSGVEEKTAFKTVSCFNDNDQVIFNFLNSTGGVSSIKLPIRRVAQIIEDENMIYHKCYIALPKGEEFKFSKLKLSEMVIPYYNESLKVKVKVSNIYIDYIYCFNSN